MSTKFKTLAYKAGEHVLLAVSQAGDVRVATLVVESGDRNAQVSWNPRDYQNGHSYYLPERAWVGLRGVLEVLDPVAVAKLVVRELHTGCHPGSDRVATTLVYRRNSSICLGAESSQSYPAVLGVCGTTWVEVSVDVSFSDPQDETVSLLLEMYPGEHVLRSRHTHPGGLITEIDELTRMWPKEPRAWAREKFAPKLLERTREMLNAVWVQVQELGYGGKAQPYADKASRRLRKAARALREVQTKPTLLRPELSMDPGWLDRLADEVARQHEESSQRAARVSARLEELRADTRELLEEWYDDGYEECRKDDDEYMEGDA